MVWTEEKDVSLCREILVVEPYQFKEKTRERGTSWTEISKHLNLLDGFTVTARAVRERYALLEAKYKKKQNDEIKASGIDVSETELDTLLEEIIARTAECKVVIDENQKKVTEKEAGESVRQQALETFKETQKRQNNDDEDSSASKPKKQRNTGSDTIAFLKEKMMFESSTRKEEIELRKKELETKEHQQQQAQEQQQSMMNMMGNSMLQMQQMTNAFIQNQQAQNQALFNILDTLSKK